MIEKSNRVSAVVGMQRKSGLRKKEIEGKHTDEGS